jgi:hypothetical protein
MFIAWLIPEQHVAHTDYFYTYIYIYIYIYILLVRVQIKDRAMGKFCSVDDIREEFID